MRSALILIGAYLFGSIPFGYLIVRGRVGADVRETGSGGTGATNVSRRAGKLAGVLTLLLDAVKGFGAVVLARVALAQGDDVDWLIAAAAVIAVCGHVFPVWLGFRGGKGVATALGVFLALAPVAVICAVLVFVCVVWLTRYVSLGSLCATLAFPACVRLLGLYAKPMIDLTPLVGASFAVAALIFFTHRDNIKRLLRGAENRFH